ncbi:5'-3' exonuclease H3TH domain-containing protein [Paenibacillus puldeungensis]|uniref:5'-3' exonuclease n=1 Tax=Paenibacillus puldeungensis TaxID=696536 RepID=A0ABW3S2L7_9BACL
MNFVQNSKPSILLVDGMALMFRAYYASAVTGYIRRTKAGVPTNAVYGFMRYFWDAVQKFGPTHIACCWDLGSKTFRTEQFAAYKGNRSDAPDDLIPQFSLIRDVMDSLSIPNVSSPGYEADDCIGSLAARFGKEMDVLILTGDHDMLQLVTERTSVIIMKKGHGNYMVYTPDSLLEEKCLTPGQIVDLKGLMGDTSDNYPGVRGIGEKTALKLVQEYGSVEGILANLDQLSKSVRAKIEADLDMLHLSRQLAEIRCDVELDCTENSCRFELNPALVVSKFEELEMASVSSWLGVV